jgi:hypothetical protein
VVQPGIRYRHYSFSVQGVPADFPYATQPSEGNSGAQIHHLVFDGQGPPPDDIGDPGDIYFDYLNSDTIKFEKLALFARMEHSWSQWPGKDLQNLLQHPHLPNYFLWQNKQEFWWTHGPKIEGWPTGAAEAAKQKEAKKDQEMFRVEAACGQSLAVNHLVGEAGDLRVPFKEGRKRPGEEIRDDGRKRVKTTSEGRICQLLQYD